MVETKISKEQIVKKVLEEYSDNKNRSLYNEEKGGTCQYLSDTGKKCAVGMFMTDKALALHGKSSKNIATLALTFGLDNLLKEEYQGYPVLFWSKLQHLHDSDHFWSEDGITEDGLAYVKREL